MVGLQKKIVIAAALVAVIASIFIVKRFSKRDTSVMTRSERFDQTSKDDRDVLQAYVDGDSSAEKAIYGAVIRLAATKDELAFESAEKLKKSESKFLREGAAQAFGYYPDSASLDSLKELLKDSEVSVRAFAFEAMSFAASDARLKLVKEALAANSISETEQIAAWASVFGLAAAETDKEAAISGLVKLAESKDETVAADAALKAIALSPKNPRVASLLENQEASHANDRVMAAGILARANNGDPWVSQNLNMFAKSRMPGVRRAALQSLHRVCPSFRWQLLDERIRAEKDSSILEILIGEAALLDRAKAGAFLAAAGTLTLPDSVKVKIQETSKSLASARGRGACEK